MLQPKRTKYRKAHKGRIKGNATSGVSLNFGAYGLKALTAERITARQIEAARRVITRHMKRTGRVWIRIFPDVPVSKKPTEVRMGKGKGTPEFWAARVKPGRVLFEVDGVSHHIAQEALSLAGAKLPIKTKFIARVGGDQNAASTSSNTSSATKHIQQHIKRDKSCKHIKRNKSCKHIQQHTQRNKRAIIGNKYQGVR